MCPPMVAAAALAGEVVDVRGNWSGQRCAHERRSEQNPGRLGEGAAAARARHRHRSHHAGALPARDLIRGAGAARVRGRPRRDPAHAFNAPQYQGAACSS